MGGRCAYCGVYTINVYTCDKCQEKIAIENKKLEKQGWKERMRKLNERVRNKK